MATRKKTPEEKRFNALAKSYNLPAFSVSDFETNVDLQKAFDSFLHAENFKVADDYSNLSELNTFHLDFLSQGCTNSDYYMDELAIDMTMELFKIVHRPTAVKIACSMYRDTQIQGFFTYQDENGQIIEEDRLQKAIDKFHSFCEQVNNARCFIQDRYPRFSHASHNEKKRIKDDLSELTKQLQVLDIDVEPLLITSSFICQYSMNQSKNMKADYLISLNLPYLTRAIAKEIVDSLSHPYL